MADALAFRRSGGLRPADWPAALSKLQANHLQADAH